MKKLICFAVILIALMVSYLVGRGNGAAYAFNNCDVVLSMRSISDSRVSIETHFRVDGCEMSRWFATDKVY